MPLSDDERAAIQAHSKPVNEWVKRVAAENAKLRARFIPAIQAIEGRGSSDAGPTDNPQVRVARGLTANESMKSDRLARYMMRRLNLFAAAHKPSVDPCDSPEQLLIDIQHKRSIADSVSDFDKYNFVAAEAAQRKADREDVLYAKFFPRLLLFSMHAPSILGDFDGKDFPRTRLDRIEAWCRDAMREAPAADPSPAKKKPKRCVLAANLNRERAARAGYYDPKAAYQWFKAEGYVGAKLPPTVDTYTHHLREFDRLNAPSIEMADTAASARSIVQRERL